MHPYFKVLPMRALVYAAGTFNVRKKSMKDVEMQIHLPNFLYDSCIYSVDHLIMFGLSG